MQIHDVTNLHGVLLSIKSRCEVQTAFATLTAPFNNMRTLNFEVQPTNAIFAAVNQVFGDSSQLPTTVEHAVIKSLSTKFRQRNSDRQ